MHYSAVDVLELLAQDSDFRKTWNGKVTCVCTDLPYGIGLPNFIIDPLWDDTTVRTIATALGAIANPEHCVVMLGVGSARQGIQWQDALKTSGFKIEKHLRVIMDTNAHTRAKRAKSKQSMLLTHHYIVVAYFGTLHVNHIGYGFLQKKHKQGYVMKEMPVCPPMYRLVDDKGCIIRTFEKHICEVLELLWTLYGPKKCSQWGVLGFYYWHSCSRDGGHGRSLQDHPSQ